MSEVFLSGFPLSPSVNECYRNVTGRGRVKTLSYRLFLERASDWAHANDAPLRAARELVGQVKPGLGIAATYVLYFKPERVLTRVRSPGVARVKQVNESKKLDLGNYLKAAEDAIFKLVEIDDAYVWKLDMTKSLALSGTERIDVALCLIPHPMV